MTADDPTWSEEVLPRPHPTGGYDVVRTFPTGEVSYFATFEHIGLRNHRLDGPARTFPGNRAYFYVHGAWQNVTDYLVEHAGHPELAHLGMIEKADITQAVGDGEIRYDALLEALDDGAPWEWALAYAKGDAP